MTPDDLIKRGMDSEFVFSSSRSSGPGGQNVNKVSTKIELRFSIMKSAFLSKDEKERLILKLKKRINKDHELIIVSQSGRSQLANKKAAIEKFFELTAKALTLQPIRRSTRPTSASRIKRVDIKKMRGQLKKLRTKSDSYDNE